MNAIKTKRINGALYLQKDAKSKDFISICEICKERELCDEPNKERSITCKKTSMNQNS